MRKRTVDVLSDLQRLREERELVKRIRYRRSKLDPYRVELVQLRTAGASIADLAYWLLHYRGRKVAPSTVSRYLSRLPELRVLDQERNR